MRDGEGLVGVCGIACEKCRSFLNKTCIIGGCSFEGAEEKLKKQKEVLGFTCPILEYPTVCRTVKIFHVKSIIGLSFHTVKGF